MIRPLLSDDPCQYVSVKCDVAPHPFNTQGVTITTDIDQLQVPSLSASLVRRCLKLNSSTISTTITFQHSSNNYDPKCLPHFLLPSSYLTASKLILTYPFSPGNPITNINILNNTNNSYHYLHVADEHHLLLVPDLSILCDLFLASPNQLVSRLDEQPRHVL